MSSQLLFVGDQSSSFLASLEGTVHGLSCRSADWRSVMMAPPPVQADLLLPVVLTGGGDLVTFLSWVRTQAEPPPVLAVLSETVALETMDHVVGHTDDFVLWHSGIHAEIMQRIRRLLPSSSAPKFSERVTLSVALAKLVGRDPAFLDLLSKVPRLASLKATVLIVGETGTGKELYARALHHLSPRQSQPFIAVNCSTLPDHLLENELFGHVRGAFTNAHRDQAGLMEMADGGTLLLDEVDSLGLSSQAKLLRFLEERVFKPLGSHRFVHVDVRIIAATNGNLEELMRQGRFRADLYFRLNALQIHLPPLRDRPGDIPLLARHFVDRVCVEAGIPRKTLTASALDKLARASWPGNVRELSNVVQRAVQMHEGSLVLPSHVALPDVDTAATVTGTGFRQAKAQAVARFERTYLEGLLRTHHGNVTRSARAAGKDRRAFSRLLKKYRIDRLTV